jgi:hypothetical protein
MHREINEFKRGYQPRSNLVKDENGDLLSDCRNIFSDVRQIEVHTAELLVSDLSPFEVDIAIAKLKMYKLPGSDQIPAELIQAGGATLRSGIHNLINSIWNREELPDQEKESIIVPIYRKGDKADCSNYRGVST